MDARLKSCPFCGQSNATASPEEYLKRYIEEEYYYACASVGCNSCGGRYFAEMHIDRDTGTYPKTAAQLIQDAVDGWNTRPDTTN